jgi:hypothetical protein
MSLKRVISALIIGARTTGFCARLRISTLVVVQYLSVLFLLMVFPIGGGIRRVMCCTCIGSLCCHLVPIHDCYIEPSPYIFLISFVFHITRTTRFSLNKRYYSLHFRWILWSHVVDGTKWEGLIPME